MNSIDVYDASAVAEATPKSDVVVVGVDCVGLDSGERSDTLQVAAIDRDVRG